MKKIYFISFIFFLVSCQKFLKETSQNLAYIEEIEDIDELLLGSGYLGQAPIKAPLEANNLFVDCTMESPIMAHFSVMDDDSREHLIPYKYIGIMRDLTIGMIAGYHRWEADPHFTLKKTPNDEKDFHNFYKRIAVLNAIFAGIEELRVKGADKTELDRVAAETYFLRAWNYFMLVNIYGIAYDKNNPEEPYGVPLKLEEAVKDIYYSRNTVGEVYRQIRDDLIASIDFFEQSNIRTRSNNRASLNSSLALLSRVYLYMEEYEKVISTVEKIHGYSLFNFDNLPQEYSFATYLNEETIFSHGSYIMARLHTEDYYYYVNMEENIFIVEAFNEGYVVSEELTKMFDENDKRLPAFFTKGFFDNNLRCRKFKIPGNLQEKNPVTEEYYFPNVTARPTSSYGWLRYSEVLLNKAEAEACLGNAEAVKTMQSFVATRYKQIPAIPSGGEELINFIRNERRKELCYEGHRLFDLKRYAVNNVYPYKTKITHQCFRQVSYNGQPFIKEDDGYVVLKEYDENSRGSWLVPIPEDVISYNQEKLVNLPRTGTEQFNRK